MSYIEKVIPKEDYQLEVQLDNGSTIILNLKSRLETVRFGILSDKKIFQTVTTDGHYIIWGDETEVSISEVFQLIQNKKVVNRNED